MKCVCFVLIAILFPLMVDISTEILEGTRQAMQGFWGKSCCVVITIFPGANLSKGSCYSNMLCKLSSLSQYLHFPHIADASMESH